MFVWSNFYMFVFCKNFYKKSDPRGIFIYKEVRPTINKQENIFFLKHKLISFIKYFIVSFLQLVYLLENIFQLKIFYELQFTYNII